jgi:hypothetical protein
MLHKGGAVLQKIWWCVFWLGCVSKPLEQGTVVVDPTPTDPSDDGGSDPDDADDGPPPDRPPPVDTGTGDDDGDDDGDADGGDEIDCSEEVDQTPVDECVMRPLMCDMERPLLSTTKRGTNKFESLDYNAHYCFPDIEPRYDGPDTVFIFEHPGTGNVNIQLHAPCGELDLIALRWQDWTSEGTCPTAETLSVTCDDSTDEGDDTVLLYEASPKEYLIIVDGPDGERSNFTLFAECP